MKILLVILAAILIPGSVFAQDAEKQINPLYTLPKVVPEKKTSGTNSTQKNQDSKALLATETGIYRVVNSHNIVPVWTDGKAKQILHVEYNDENNHYVENWFFVTSKGIIFSKDLTTFEERNTGLPVLTIKKYDGKDVTFEKQIADIKDISYNPMKPNEMVCATKDKIFLSRDGGTNWNYYNAPRSGSSGIKAVAVTTVKEVSEENVSYNDVLLCSHATLGFFYSYIDSKNKKLISAQSGLASSDPANGPDEVSDILPVLCRGEDDSLYTEIFTAQTFIPRIYRFDFAKKKSVCIFKGTEPSDTIDGLVLADSSLVFLSPRTVKALEIAKDSEPKEIEKFSSVKNLISLSPSAVFASWISPNECGFKNGIVLNESWLINSQEVSSPYAKQISSQKSLYVPAYQAQLPNGIEKFKKIILDNKLNSLVIDMKDDYGLLRYDSKDSFVLSKAKTSQYAVDLEKFVSEFKKENIYLIARIVVFKDRNLSKYGKSKYAVWNSATDSAWVGTRGYETDDEGNKTMTYYDENWVDPYCPEVWEYDVAIAKELIARGFDEIQFDYIRFPTDGLNLGNAKFRWKSEGMDKESALISFLSYARENIDAPIGIDIYGANGWYRTGARTGQDVETLAEYVDVICPMFYPSHFENRFLNYEPYEERPYRIYFYGTYRNSIIARNKIVVRPWVQTFFLNVPYDRQFYDSEYVKKEIFGVRDSVDRGYMHWNNAGNYSKLSPDPGDSEYTGKAYEADKKYRRPAIGQKEENDFETELTSEIPVVDTTMLWDSIINNGLDNL